MEGILAEFTVWPGVFLAPLALLVLAVEGILLGSLADKKKA